MKIADRQPCRPQGGEEDDAKMTDLLAWVLATDRYSEMTQRDYRAQILRCRKVYNVNHLGDISADLRHFEARFPKKNGIVSDFKTPDSYDAWRRKMVSVLKGFSGLAEEAKSRRRRDDKWQHFLESASGLVGSGTGHPPQFLIPLHKLADEARKHSLDPNELNDEWLEGLVESMKAHDRATLVRAVRNLEKLRTMSDELAAMLPDGSFKSLQKARRKKNQEIPYNLNDALEKWIEVRCRGHYDVILKEWCGSKSPKTAASYRAALKKYILTAIEIDAMQESDQNLSAALSKSVFVAVVRKWINESDPSRKVSDRTMKSYVSTLAICANDIGQKNDFMILALKTNRNLLSGRAAEEGMTPETKMLCARVLSDRRLEMTFRSLHVAFERKALELMGKSDGMKDAVRRKIIQFGVLAAFSAVELWCLPLRIENAQALTIRGDNPTLILPRKADDVAYINIPAAAVKNRRRLYGEFKRERNRGREVLDWYLNEIRPLIPYSCRSKYLFPGYDGERLSAGSLRNWLFTQSRALGLPMKPHQFRHLQASLYLRANPGSYSEAARLLGDAAETVRKYYAWIDDEAEMRKVQEEIARIGGIAK